MSAAAFDRHLPLAGTYNLRDVGGYATSGGGTTRWRTLLRADALHRVDEQGWDEIGVRTVIDLREDGEHAKAPHAIGGRPVVVRRMPVLDRLGTLPADWTLAELYRILLDTRGQQVAAAVAALAEPGALPAVVHCTAGKDRTGIVIALTLSAVGVDDATIAADYALTAQYLVGGYIDEARARAQAMGGAEVAHFSCEPELILGVLDHVRQTSGDAGGYLVEHGMTTEQLTTLREALVEGPSIAG